MGNKLSKIGEFIKKHPVLSNMGLIIIAGFVLLWLSLLWVDSWTGHGEYRVVPDVKGLPYSRAVEILEESDLYAELSDSLYDDTAAPGTVLEQVPKINSKIKPNRKVYLTISAFSPKKVTVPNLTDVSLRQAQSILEGLGIANVRVVKVPSEYKDLVIDVKFNGLSLNAGTRIPVSATVTLEVGEGYSSVADSIATDSISPELLQEPEDDFGMF